MEKSVHLRMPELLYKDSEQIKKDFGFSSIQEFIKESIRKAIYEYKKQKALATLKKYYGSKKDTKRLTDEERDKLAEGLTPEKSREISKRYGF